MIGAVFALFVAASVYFSLYAALTLICIGVAAGAYLGFRYGDPFLVWILKLWNRPGD
jgi:ABC-type microcin C transport system permease subunit YejE